MKAISISFKVAISLILIGIIPLVVISNLATESSKESLKNENINRLKAVAKIKKDGIVRYFDRRFQDVKVLAQVPTIPEAVYVLDSLSKISKELGHTLSTDLLNYPPLKEAYDKYIGYFKEYKEKYGFYDVFVVSPNSGRIVLSVSLEEDYGKELKSETNHLAKAWQTLKETKQGQITDFELYEYSEMQPSMFFLEPVFLNQEYVGSVVVQISTNQINNIMQERTGMGATGETYLVGSDYKMRSDSYLDKDNRNMISSLKGTVEKNGVKTKATEKALNGESGFSFVNDYNGNKVASVYEPLNIGNIKWAIISEIDEAEVYAAANSLNNSILNILYIVIALVIIIALFLSRSISKGIKNVISQLNSLINSVIEGKLDVRGDPKAVIIDFKSIIENINDLINAFVQPLNVVAEYVDRVSKGDIPPKVTEDYKGDFNEIKNNLNHLIDTVNRLVSDTKTMSSAAANYDFSKRADADMQQGEFRTLLLGINATLDNIVNPLNELIGDVVEMSQAATDGKLDKRIDVSKHKGDFVKVAEGFNETLNNLILPLNVAAEYVDRISKGDLPPKIVDEYKGDFNELKNNLNTCIDAIGLLVSDSNKLNEAAAHGILDVRADETFHHGEFRSIVHGVNTTLDKMSEPLKDATEFLNKVAQGQETSTMTKPDAKGAYAIAYTGMNTLKSFLDELNKDLANAAANAVSGDTSTNIDTNKYPGNWNKITLGINSTIEAFANPLNVALISIDSLSKGTLPPRIENNFEGDFSKLIINLNSLIEVFSTMNKNLLHTIEEQKNGEITSRCDITGMEGLYLEIMSGVNKALDSIAEPVVEAIEIIDMYADGNLSKSMRKLPGKQIILTNAMNKIRENLMALVDDVKMLASAAHKGTLSTRADINKHTGEFRNVVIGVNQTLDNIVTPLTLAAQYVTDISEGNLPDMITEKWEGDFNHLKENLNRCITAIEQLVNDANMLAEAAFHNQLETRANEDLHYGDFKKVIQGVHRTLDIVSESKGEADRLAIAQADVLDNAGEILKLMSQGDLRKMMLGEYDGEHKVLKIL